MSHENFVIVFITSIENTTHGMLAYIFYCLHDIFCFRNTVDADPRWCCTYLLGPSDALFIEVGQAFIKQQIKGMYLSFFFLATYETWFCSKVSESNKRYIDIHPFLLSFSMYAEYGDVTNIYNWYGLLICIFGMSPECIVWLLSVLCMLGHKALLSDAISGMVYLSLLTNEFSFVARDTIWMLNLWREYLKNTVLQLFLSCK